MCVHQDNMLCVHITPVVSMTGLRFQQLSAVSGDGGGIRSVPSSPSHPQLRKPSPAIPSHPQRGSRFRRFHDRLTTVSCRFGGKTDDLVGEAVASQNFFVTDGNRRAIRLYYCICTSTHNVRQRPAQGAPDGRIGHRRSWDRPTG